MFLSAEMKKYAKHHPKMTNERMKCQNKDDNNTELHEYKKNTGKKAARCCNVNGKWKIQVFNKEFNFYPISEKFSFLVNFVYITI